MVVIDFTKYLEIQQAEQRAVEEARHAELARRASLEWTLADLLADIEAA
ncbi:MAG: hypothetical protein P4M15_01805 [Alphaproteobacteria bacterium]|nr:hypothetical protein [Alphaproteobacteria bacterium]